MMPLLIRGGKALGIRGGSADLVPVGHKPHPHGVGVERSGYPSVSHSGRDSLRNGRGGIGGGCQKKTAKSRYTSAPSCLSPGRMGVFFPRACPQHSWRPIVGGLRLCVVGTRAVFFLFWSATEFVTPLLPEF